MLNYKSTNIIFICLLIVLAVSRTFFLYEVGYVVAVLSMVYIILLSYSAIDFRMMFYFKTKYYSKTNEKILAISFDDGPADKTVQVLDILKKYNIKAAFFIVGERAEKQKQIITRMDLEGHIIGNHSYTHHFWFDLFSTKRMIEELKNTEKIIESIVSKKMKLFRPPYGVTNPSLEKALCEMNYNSIGWSLKSKDTVIKNRQKIEKRLRRKLKEGSIILFHDTTPNITEVLSNFIEYALQCNYKIVRLDDLLNIKAYE